MGAGRPSITLGLAGCRFTTDGIQDHDALPVNALAPTGADEVRVTFFLTG